MSLTEEHPTQLDDKLSIVCRENCTIVQLAGTRQVWLVIFKNLLIVEFVKKVVSGLRVFASKLRRKTLKISKRQVVDGINGIG